MRNVLLTVLIAMGTALNAQSVLSLDSCRTLAMRNNKQLAIASADYGKAHWEHKAARTNYLPKISLDGGYMRTSKPISLLSSEQQDMFANLGTSLAQPLSQQLLTNKGFLELLKSVQQNHPDLLPLIMHLPEQVKGGLNEFGQQINDAFHTDTRNMTAGAVLFTQPLYMGGKIRAYDKITHYAEKLAEAKQIGVNHEVILEVDKAYWQIVNLAAKKRLATQYRDMLTQLESDVQHMVNEGVATRANALNVSVKLNEAEMTLAKVEDGLALSRMLLCQICGLPLSNMPLMADESNAKLAAPTDDVIASTEEALANRPELQQLQLATEIYRQKVNIARSEFLPTLAMTGGYGFSNPSLTNGFERRFRGLWNVGVVLKVPVWNWLESRDKVRAAKAEALGYQYRLEEAREKIELQVNQQTFRVNEANRKYRLAEKNMEKAQENLRIAQLGHKEGVITTTDLLGAQTAWLSAQSDQIDAMVDIYVTRATLNNILGK